MKSKSLFSVKPLVLVTLGALAGVNITPAQADGQVTIIQTGDFHGHLTARPNLRSTKDYEGQMVGGLARVATKIKEVQAGKGGAGNTVVLHTGDTIQGSGEALYTKGQAVVDVVDMLGIDQFAPGNWDFVYGKDRFEELFAQALNPNLPTLPEQTEGRTINAPFGTRWGGLAANLYLTSQVGNAPKDPTATGTDYDSNISQAEYDAYAQWYAGDQANGEPNAIRVLPPYAIRYINNVKVGIIGCTTSRGPQVVGRWVTSGLEFTDCSNEIKKYAKKLRTEENVEVLALISEIEIGRNIQIIKSLGADQHIDVVLNSDMHEETLKPIEVTDAAGNKTWIMEAGQDGTLLNEITIDVHAGQPTTVSHQAHRIDDRIVEDEAVAAKVAQVRAPFNEGFDASIPCDINSPYLSPFSTLGIANPTDFVCLNGPLSQEIGRTDVALHRSNYAHENMPAAVEGTSHDFVADAMKWWAKSDMATVRGFRYGTHVAPGPITRNDIYHFVPIAPRVGKVSRISANQLRNQIDNSSLAVFSSDPNNAVTPRPSYNNAVYAPGGSKENLSPGADLPVKGGSGNALGFGGGWLFSYSANGFHMDFDPYFRPSWQTLRNGSPFDAVNKLANGNTVSGIYLETTGGNNGQYANPPTDTSRARNLTVTMSCDKLPAGDKLAKQVGWNGAATDAVQIALGNDVTCAVGGTGYTGFGKTVITKAKDGSYMPSWIATYATGTTYTPYLLNPSYWQYLQGTPNQPNTTNTVNQHFKAPLFTAAGYWYPQSPNTVNNCNNCYPMGRNTIAGDANAAYILPVNADANGNASLDANGNPVYVRDSNGALVWEGDVNDKPSKASLKPKLAGTPIALTEVVEKYLASLTNSTVTNADLPQNRISLVKTRADGTGNDPSSLPNFATDAGFNGDNGFPVMQPLCGTIGKSPTTAASCP